MRTLVLILSLSAFAGKAPPPEHRPVHEFAPEQRELPHDAVPIEHNEPAGGIGWQILGAGVGSIMLALGGAIGIWVHRHKGGAA